MNWTREKVPPTDGRQRLDRQRLGQSGHALQQAVATGDETGEHPLDRPVLADDDLLDLEQELLEHCGLGRGGRGGRPGAPVGIGADGGAGVGVVGDGSICLLPRHGLGLLCSVGCRRSVAGGGPDRSG